MLLANVVHLDRKHACPVPSCECGYEEKKLLKRFVPSFAFLTCRHFKIKHPDRLNDFPDLIAEKRKWQRPGETRAHHCDVPGCTSSYSSVSNLKQHVRVEHPDLYHEKFPNSTRRRRSTKESGEADDSSGVYSSDDEEGEAEESTQDSYSEEVVPTKSKTNIINEQIFMEEGIIFNTEVNTDTS